MYLSPLGAGTRVFKLYARQLLSTKKVCLFVFKLYARQLLSTKKVCLLPSWRIK